MKKLIISVSVAMLSIAGFAASPSSNWFLSSDKGQISCEKINVGTSKARILLENGEKISISIADIDSYSIDGKIYNKKMLYSDGKPTGKMAFMQLIDSKNGLSLYESAELDYESVEPLQPVKYFYVYMGEALHLALNEETLPSVFNFFGVKWSYR